MLFSLWVVGAVIATVVSLIGGYFCVVDDSASDDPEDRILGFVCVLLIAPCIGLLWLGALLVWGMWWLSERH